MQKTWILLGIQNEVLTNGLRFKDWLNNQSFEIQYKEGIRVLKMFGG